MSLILATFSCDDFLDVNQSPNSPTKADLRYLLTAAQQNMTVALSQGNYVGRDLGVLLNHNVTRESPNRYTAQPNQNGYHNSWNAFYILLPNLEEIIINGATQNNWHLVGIAKIMKSFVFMHLVDLWGDVPYTEALQMNETMHPKVDDGAFIYNQALALLKDAKADFAKTDDGINSIRPGASDLIYGGNVANWTRFANTLMLRMLNNTKKVKSTITGWDGLLAEAMGGDRITAATNFQFLYSGTRTPADERMPGFTSSYGTTQHTQYPSPWLYEIMRGYDQYNTPQNPFAEIIDPRIPWYFYRQIGPRANLPSGVPGVSYRDNGFISIFFGDESQFAAGTVISCATLWGLYPIGGRFDANDPHWFDGWTTTSGISATTPAQVATSGDAGRAIQKLFTFADLKFIEAEMMLDGTITGDARATLKTAIEEAFAHINATSGGRPGAPASIAAAVRDAYVTAVLNKYDDGTPARKMEIIITQKWIHDVMNPAESFADIRRTGYPVIFDPRNPRGGITPENPNFTTAFGADAVRLTTAIGNFPNSLWYPLEEEFRNDNLTQKPNESVKVFWHP